MSLKYVAAIDPLALVLPSHVYQTLVEKFHPHLPKLADIREVARTMNATERAHALESAQSLIASGKAIEEALGAQR